MHFTRNDLLGAGIALAAIPLLLSEAAAQQRFQCPRTGGDLIYAIEGKVPSLDQHTSPAQATRNVAMNVFETLITRDESMRPMLDLAESVNESPDGLHYVFKLRQGIVFHNGKPMTSADVLASFERYKRVGVDRSILDVVERFETPDPLTFTMVLKERRPIFLEAVSAFTIPIVIVPAELASAPAQQLQTVGTGPFQLVEFIADSHVKLRRYDGYRPDTRHNDLAGFGGYKQPCVNTVTFRMMPESAARTAALEVGEVHGVEDVPAASLKRIQENREIKLSRLENFWLHITYPNFSAPPTDNLKVRQAIQAALDAQEIMEASSDGAYSMNPSLQFPGSAYYTEIGKELYNQKNRDKARRLLQEAGYKGEKVTLLTNRDYASLYNAALVMSQQLKAVGINAELLVLDWPAALQKSQQMNATDWNFFYTGWITVTALGGVQSLRFLANPTNVHKPLDNQSDPEFMQHWTDISRGVTLDERREAFARAQKRALDQVMVIPFGVMPKVQAVRSNVEHFRSYFMPRMSNVWLKS
jgi:peptide/nickel transport system substrate-binding protein